MSDLCRHLLNTLEARVILAKSSLKMRKQNSFLLFQRKYKISQNFPKKIFKILSFQSKNFHIECCNEEPRTMSCLVD